MDEQHEAVKKMLEANTTILQELSGWKPKVQADVEELQVSVRNLYAKVDQIAVKQESAASPAYKVYDTENLDLTGSTMVSLSTKPYGATSRPSGHGDEHDHRGLGNGVVTPSFLPRSQVRDLP